MRRTAAPRRPRAHYIEVRHDLVTSGAHGFVRHPAYLVVFLIWLGLAAAFENVLTLLVTALYGVPVSLLYIRAEEAMLLEEFGQPYEAYRDRVGMVLPRFGRAS